MIAGKKGLVLFAVTSLAAAAASAADQPSGKLSDEAMRGRYLAQITGCNDCHTAGYAESAGKVEESKWLTGDRLGWSGPLGTTYAANLRLAVKDMTADQFLILARSPLRPPMPWFNFRDMKDGDVKAIDAYLKHLGPAGEPAPAYVPPDNSPAGPFVKFPEPPKKPGA
jgi:mono/diheme cytochrome c family protein